MAEKTPVEQLTYKQASQELELIIRSLESGDMELEESLESYTRGVELLKSLRTRLADAEQKVSVLLKDVDGNDVLAERLRSRKVVKKAPSQKDYPGLLETSQMGGLVSESIWDELLRCYCCSFSLDLTIISSVCKYSS